MRQYRLKVEKAAMVSTEMVVEAESYELACERARMIARGKWSTVPAPSDWVIGKEAPGGGHWVFEPLEVAPVS
jgi:hypothetical protein